MKIEFVDEDGTFFLDNADDTSYLYFPITNEGGIMGSITPTLHGDSKTGQNSFLMEPVSSENLHSSNMGRNVWCKIEGKGVWSISGCSAKQQANRYGEKDDKSSLIIGKMWHMVRRCNKSYGITADILNFSPPTKEKVEIMKVTFCNTGNEEMKITPTVAIPLYGRSADNLRDHRHVTSLLNRIDVEEEGVLLTPSLSFDERGHQRNSDSYGVYARGEDGQKAIGFYPILEEFIGEGGSLLWPKAVVTDDIPFGHTGDIIQGYEGMGGIRFEKTSLMHGERKSYYIILSYNKEGLKYLREENAEKAFLELKGYWNAQSKIRCHTKAAEFDKWMEWVSIQPSLRRIYGCSFLPHHDYGRGGRGWRDLWQDSLALLLVNPEKVRPMLISYFDGVRIDGSNATIIGNKPGEFIADRNSIVRVWMDHGLWPLITIKQYINITGDFNILLEERTYFKDKVSHRGEQTDALWKGNDSKLKTKDHKTYQGSILEHLLVQHLSIFYDVGEHNHMKLRGADWNDALDMAKEHGESIAFTAAYSGNLKDLSQLVHYLRMEKGIAEINLAEELLLLLDPPESLYGSYEGKQVILNQYCETCGHNISGIQRKVKLIDLEENLQIKANWIQNHIRKTEWIHDTKTYQWFNGYYDNNKNRVEGEFKNGVRMMLTSQVFTIMSGTATDEQVAEICKSADQYLYDEQVGGYRLNTNFNEIKTDLGRMFGFAYGHKENGAVFSHMAVMYAYSLYSRGFVKEGYKAIKALYKQVMNFDKSRIYPGIPEYFNEKGRGMYHYLTGAASWLVFTVLTEMFGVKGAGGDLLLQPQLLAEQFDENGLTEISCRFAGQDIKVIYENKNFKEIGDYDIEEIYIDGRSYQFEKYKFQVKREVLQQLIPNIEHVIHIIIG